MKGLYIKDIRLLLKQKTFFFVFLFLAVFNSLNLNSLAIIPSLMIFFLVTLVFTTITYDEKDHGLSFLFTLPISRKKYVQAKYLLALAIMAIALLVSSGIVLILNAVQSRGTNLEALFLTFGFVSLLGILYTSLLLPIYFRFGEEKSRLILIIVMGVILLFSFAGSYLLMKMNTDVQDLISGIRIQSLWQLLAIGLITAVAVFGFSYFMSVKIMKKKEL